MGTDKGALHPMMCHAHAVSINDHRHKSRHPLWPSPIVLQELKGCCLRIVLMICWDTL